MRSPTVALRVGASWGFWLTSLPTGYGGSHVYQGFRSGPTWSSLMLSADGHCGRYLRVRIIPGPPPHSWQLASPQPRGTPLRPRLPMYVKSGRMSKTVMVTQP
jgi:hypothetical protein